ncbi:MAG: histone acetyltransferase 1 [Marteilia pararefringens]
MLDLTSGGDEQKYMVQSNSALSLTFRSASKQLEDFIASPVYTHHIFDKEIIYGYENLQLNIIVDRTSLDMQLCVKFDEQIDLPNLKIKDFAEYFESSIGLKFKDSTSKSDGECDISNIHGKEVQRLERDDGIYLITSIKQANDKETELIMNFQFLNHFFIENASNIDPSDENWEFLILYKYYPDIKSYAACGYLSFYNFFHYPDKIRRRLAQILILPEFQNRGLAKFLVKTLYEISKEDDKTYDVTVEDPNVDFCYMRDKLDLSIIKQSPNSKMLEDYSLFKKSIKKEFKFSNPQIYKLYKFMKILEFMDEEEKLQNVENDLFEMESKAQLNLLKKAEKIKQYDEEFFQISTEDFYGSYIRFKENFKQCVDFLKIINE